MQELIVAPPVPMGPETRTRLERVRHALYLVTRGLDTEMQLNPVRVMGLPATVALLSSGLSLYISGLIAAGTGLGVVLVDVLRPAE